MLGSTALPLPSVRPRPARARKGPLAPRVVPRMRADRLSAAGPLVECVGCGSRAVAAPTAEHCPLCGSSRLRACPGAGRVIAPEGLLPFAVDPRTARRSIRRWAWARWLAPRGWARALDQQAPADVYVPYWVLDARTQCQYRGLRGEERPDTGHRSDVHRLRPERAGRRIRWRPARGSVRLRFADLLVCASRSLPEHLVRRLPPWDLSARVAHRPERALASWTERYAVEPAEGLRMARARTERAIREAVRRDIGGDRQRIHDLHVERDDARFCHVLVPLWIRAVRYRGRLWRVLVDGRTGRVVGEHPRSPVKIAAGVLLGLGLVLAGLLQ